MGRNAGVVHFFPMKTRHITFLVAFIVLGEVIASFAQPAENYPGPILRLGTVKSQDVVNDSPEMGFPIHRIAAENWSSALARVMSDAIGRAEKLTGEKRADASYRISELEWRVVEIRKRFHLDEYNTLMVDIVQSIR
jgi:hypothetical protein